MKKIKVILLIAVLIMGCLAVGAIAQEPLTIMTFNNLSSQFGAHFGLGPTLMSFDEKRALQALFLEEYAPDLVGLQEADPHYAQVDYLLGHLSDYSATLTEGELAILYKHDILELKESVYVPSVPVAVARFAVKETGQEFYLFNVHLGGGTGSIRSAQLILNELPSIVQKTPDPVNVILLGDFNASRGDEAWSILAGEEYLPFRDSWITASNRIGEEARIDWILYSGSLKPLSCETIRYTVNERHVSDHPAVQANFIFEEVEPSEYEYSDLGFSSTEVETGRELEVKTTITNLGGLGSPEVGLYVNERLVDTKWFINIQSGKSREITFATALYQPGGYRIGIDNLAPQTVKVVKSVPLIQLGAAASFQLSGMTLPEIILVGKEFDVTASIKNEGRYRGSANVNLYVDGWLTQSTIVDLSPGESRIVGFPLALLKEGTHEVGIGPLSGIVEVAMEPPMVFQDMSDNGNDARVFGGAHWVQGKVGRAIRLNGVDAYAEVEHSELFNVQRGFTIAVWFKALDYGLMAGQNYLVADEGYPFGWEIEVRGTGPYFEINTKEDPAQKKPHCWHLWGQTPLEANRWYFSAFTIDSDGSMKMYLNGEEEPFRESTKEGMIELEKLLGQVCYNTEAPNPLYVGTRADRRSYFKGVIDEVLFYRKALTKEEIQQIFQGDAPSKEGLILWLSFD